MKLESTQLAEHILSDTSLELSIRILNLLETSQWDNSIFHHFACDCAERALHIEQAQGHKPKQELWDAIATKRSWIAGQASKEELTQAQLTTQKIVHECAHQKKGYEASLSVADALAEVRYAPRASAWALTAICLHSESPHETLREEAEWQRYQMLSLIQNAELQPLRKDPL